MSASFFALLHFAAALSSALVVDCICAGTAFWATKLKIIEFFDLLFSWTDAALIATIVAVIVPESKLS